MVIEYKEIPLQESSQKKSETFLFSFVLLLTKEEETRMKNQETQHCLLHSGVVFVLIGIVDLLTFVV